MANSKRPAAPKRGRPPKNPLELASERLNLKLTAADKAQLDELLAIVERKSGRPVNISALLRRLVSEELVRQR